MPHKTSWLIVKRVILIEYIDDVDKDELIVINEDLHRYAEEGIAPIHIVSDHSRMGKVRLELKIIQESSTVLGLDVWGQFVIANADILTNFFGEAIRIFSKLDMKTVPTREKALQLIIQNDSTLQD